MSETGSKAQLRRGVVEYCVLAMLQPQPRYGFELVQLLSESGALLTNEGTVYPLLSRLRNEGLVTPEWRESTEGPPRRYYKLSPLGKRALDTFKRDWVQFRQAVDTVLLGGKS